MAGISRPISPAFLAEAATSSKVGPDLALAGAGAAATAPVDRDRAALEVRLAKARAGARASSAPSPAVSHGASKDPAYCSQYLKDIHTIICRSFAEAAARDGITDEREWMYIPIPTKLFTVSFFKRVELIRSQSIAEGGLARGPTFLAQAKFNKMVFDLIRETLAKINDNTSIEFTPGIGAAGLVVGVKGERAAITSFNFISKIEKKMLDAVFHKRKMVWVEGRFLGSYVERPETVDDYVERIARESVGEAVEREYAYRARMLSNPSVVKAMRPYAEPYMAAVPDPRAEMSSEERAARTREADRLAATAFAAGERVFKSGTLAAAASVSSAATSTVSIGGGVAFKAFSHTSGEVAVASRAAAELTPAEAPCDDTAESARTGTASATTVGSVSPGEVGPALAISATEDLG